LERQQQVSPSFEHPLLEQVQVQVQVQVPVQGRLLLGQIPESVVVYTVLHFQVHVPVQ
jgi:hypothetical protein